jgi:hypothetical protein
LNHYIISGDFNKGGIKDMNDFTTNRGIHKVEVQTRNLNELDAIYCSEGIEIVSMISGYDRDISDHAWIKAKLRMTTECAYTDYLVEEDVTMGIIRQRLASENNVKKRAEYSLFDGPFKNFALLGE